MTSHLWPLVAVILGLLAYRATVSIFSRRRVSHEEFEQEMSATGDMIVSLKAALDAEQGLRVAACEQLRFSLETLETKFSETDHSIKRLDARIAPPPVKRLG